MSLKNRFENIRSEFKNVTSVHDNQVAKLIAVSKTFSTAAIREVYDLDQKDFAENYVNEFVEKFSDLSDLKIYWHFIGHLQTNKVDKVVGRADLIHSVDSEKLLKKIISDCEKKQIQQKVLLQVKFGSEQTKYGFEMEEIDFILENYKYSNRVLFCGLMCILPLGLEDQEKLSYFQKLSHKLVSVKKELNLTEDFKELSMGMSDDFKLAISAGSTMIRIGSAIFGVRS
jgi:hypothetical protein